MMYGSSIFFGIRFFLAGFTPQQILEDDPICVTARRDKKTLVTIIWLKDSLRYGEPIGIGNIMYRPLKDLNGIPGANKLIICLTGYQGMDREDMKMMVQLMGAQISKPLVVSTVTHLICYKFEGEKYELAKKMNVTKVVNHRWLVDCLEAWKILPEEPYSSRSGYELDMEAEAKDSEDEVEDISGRNNDGITIMQNEMGKAHSHFVLARNLPDPSTQQGFSHNDGKLLQSDNSDFLKSASVNKLGKQPVLDRRAQSLMEAKVDNVDEPRAAFPLSNQTGNGRPSTSENPKNAGDFDAENCNSLKYSRKTPQKTALPSHVEEGLGNTIGSLKAPLSSRKTPRSGASLQTAGKSGKSGGRSKDKSTKKIIEDMPTFNLDIDKAEDASGFLGEPSSKRHDESDASKLNSLKSRKSPAKSSLSLQSPGKLSNQDGKLEIPLAEKVIADVCTFNIGPDQGKATSECRATSAEKANLFDENGPGALLPQKRTSDGASHSTPKSQKLTSSASKRVDASEPHEKRSSGALNSGCQIGDEFATPSVGRSSPNVSSSKLKAKTVASSRSLAFEMLQGGEPMNTDSPTTPFTNSVSTSPVVGNNNGQPQTLQKVTDTSLGTNDLEAEKSGNLKLNSTDQNDIPKPSKKKMVARKTLGSKSKVCRRSADVQRSCASKDSFRDDAAIHSAGQENKEPPTASPAADKVFVPPAVEESNGLGSKPHLGTESNNFATLLDDETEAPPELNVDNEPLAAEQSLLVKSKSGEASGMLLHQTDGQGMPVAETVDMKKNLISQKGLAVKARKKSLLAAKEAAKDADEAEAGKVKEQVGGVAAKKRRGTLLLNKSKRPVEAGKEIEPISYDRVEVGREHELDCNDQYENKGGKQSGKLAVKSRRGTLLSNRSKGPVEVNNENDLVDCYDGQNGSKNCPADLAAPSNMTLDNMEIKRKNDTGVFTDQGTRKVSKRSGKLKMSNAPAEAEMENEPVLDGGQYSGKQVGAPGILDSSVEVDKENEPILATNLDTSKGVKRAGKLAGKKKGGTLLLNKYEGQVNEENKNKPDLDDEEVTNKGGIFTEKLTSKSNSTINESDAVKGGKRAGKLVGKKRRGTLVINKSEVQVNEGNENKLVLDDEVDTSNGTEKLTSKPNLTVNESDAASKDGKRAGKLPGKKRRGTLVLNKSQVQANEESRNKSVLDGDEDASNGKEELTSKSNMLVNESDTAFSNPLNIELKKVQKQAACFILCGHRLQRKEFQQLIKRLRGKVCRDSHQWSYQASHFVVPEPIRRTEKFFAAAASGSWILKTDYLIASSQAGKFLPEEPYEWHKTALSEDGAISFEAPRKWRLLREKTGHGAFYGMRIVIYGECIAPPLDTLKRVIKAGDGTILATSPPYTRILESGVDFAIVSPGMPRVDLWVQEFLKHQIPCVLADYLVEYVCKPGYTLDRHVQYNTHEWAAKSFSKLLSLSEEVVADNITPPDDQVSDDLGCQVCGSTDRGEVMLVCGDESGSTGCGIGTHIDCCDPPLESIPEEDWFCPKCTE
uniref:BRCT domain-containing protein n=1 Tax=Chenopodium quinoa TaxID=63459 RepID=A0A803M7K8_CHEQI